MYKTIGNDPTEQTKTNAMRIINGNIYGTKKDINAKTLKSIGDVITVGNYRFGFCPVDNTYFAQTICSCQYVITCDTIKELKEWNYWNNSN